MSYQISVTDDAISMRFALEKVTFRDHGVNVETFKLPMPLSFACKAANLTSLEGGTLAAVYVFKRINMDPLGFDAFTRNLCRDTDWLKGLSMSLPVADARACVMVVAAGRPLLFIDTQGASYARYVARLA
jgi:hypothetical protein